MKEYNFTIEEKVVVGIADEVIQYLKGYPDADVECTVTKVILHEDSPFSDKSIINTARKLLFPLLFNGEQVDLLSFICRMFEMRGELIDRVIEYVTRAMQEYGILPISDPDKDKDFPKFLLVIVKILSTLWDKFN